MAWFYDMLIDAGSASEPASWAVCAVSVLAIYFIFKSLIAVFTR